MPEREMSTMRADIFGAPQHRIVTSANCSLTLTLVSVRKSQECETPSRFSEVGVVLVSLRRGSSVRATPPQEQLNGHTNGGISCNLRIKMAHFEKWSID